jgi:hypothetical protein
MFLIYSVKVVIFCQMTKFLLTYFRAKQLVFRLFNFYKKGSGRLHFRGTPPAYSHGL